MKKRFFTLIVIAYAIFIGIGAVQVNAVSEICFMQNQQKEVLEIYQTKKEIALPVLMYHRVFNGGHKSSYIITPKQLEEDLIELKKAGYIAVLPSEVLAFVEGKGTLPSRPIMITFDDGHYNNLHYALPLFKKHGFNGVINVVGKFCEYATVSDNRGKPASSFLTWNEVAKLEQSALFEIGSHTYNMHDYKPRFGIRRLEDESDEKYYEALKQDDTRLKKALKEKANIETNVFAYPFGAYYGDSCDLITGLGYKVIFTANQKINYIKQGDFEALRWLGRINRESDWTSKQMIEKILN